MEKPIKFDLIKIPFFSSLSGEELDFIKPYLEEKQFSKGEIILSQGSQGGDLYLIVAGVVCINLVFPGNYQKNITKLAQGQLFGDVTFLTKALVTASVLAEESVSCVILHYPTLELLKHVKPEIAYKIEQEVLHHIASRFNLSSKSILDLLNKIPEKQRIAFDHALYLENKKAKNYSLKIGDLNLKHLHQINFFPHLTHEQKELLLPFMKVKRYEKGYRFLKTNYGQNKLAFLYSGAAMFFIKEHNELKKSLAVLKTGDLLLGDFFHEDLQLLADYLTCEDSIFLELDLEIFKGFQHSQPKIFYAINDAINQAITDLIYIMNREWLRLNSEYNNV
ncbi:MAG: cyclic nucleotide-binding domain-containing protein [Tatlockia sp.]|nr:cyclic nucleotide-binding domain-containing protein [Tatlockia sp.]